MPVVGHGLCEVCGFPQLLTFRTEGDALVTPLVGTNAVRFECAAYEAVAVSVTVLIDPGLAGPAFTPLLAFHDERCRLGLPTLEDALMH